MFVGAGVKQGVNTVSRDHFDMLRTLEDMFDLRTNPANAGSLTPVSSAAQITDVWTGAPTQLVGVPFSATRVDLTWVDTNTNEDGFRIERSAAGANSWTELGTAGPNVTAYSDTTASAGTSYDYRVRAYTGATNTDYSNVTTVTTSVPGAPSALTAIAPATGTTIALHWTDNGTNESGFHIERSSNGVDFAF